MKNIKTILFASVLLLTGCNTIPNTEKINILAPSGTPLLAISPYLHENKNNINYSVADGPDGLAPAFSSGSHDIIVAPINLGANVYSKNQKYVLFETIVWGNLYVVSNNKMNSFLDLKDKTITLFGTNQTPDIIMKSLARENNIEYETVRLDSVENVNSYFMQNKAEYIVSAEPSLSVLKSKKPNLQVLDLQEEWKKITGNYSYPQAGIFVLKEKAQTLKTELLKMKNNILTILDDVDYSAECALETPLKKLGKEALKTALPNSHIGINENQKEAIEFYFNKLLDLELGHTIGNCIPDENFYLKF